MSSLSSLDKRKLEDLLGMKSGYVISSNALSNRTFAEFFQERLSLDIYSGKYSGKGDSKANHLRSFWELEPDKRVGEALAGLLELWVYENPLPWDGTTSALFQECETIVARLKSAPDDPGLHQIKNMAVAFDAKHLAEQIRRMEKSVEDDPPLALGTAKELLETCCRTILRERGKPVAGSPDMPALLKVAMKELNLVPESVPAHAKGGDIIKRLLSNLGSICQCMVQAARSGVQNIAEGSVASGTSKKMELKLTNVAKASLAELRLDYEDFLRQRGLRLWDDDDPRRKALVARRCATADEVAAWVLETARNGRDGLNGPDKPSIESMQSILFPEIAANAALVLIGVASALLDRQVAAQAAAFESVGGFTERLYKTRQARRHQQ